MALSFAVAVNDRTTRRLVVAHCFILEIPHRSWEAAVLNHVWVALQLERELEWNGLYEGFVLKDSGADQLSRDLGEHEIVAGVEDVGLVDLGFLKKLLRLEFGFFGEALNRSLFEG